ncbi:hypothetical protein C8R41DRAFT_832721 [Lentinula lateritia]|uniref:Uncharacterized protein n=1 Tax=Lentinula lateritia TaxID=40482 RepID=A0ABQ8VF48_9AGAR|nr:hypothetical protein C8R41DRAFT_832721 [Lentinula lateritia]
MVLLEQYCFASRISYQSTAILNPHSHSLCFCFVHTIGCTQLSSPIYRGAFSVLAYANHQSKSVIHIPMSKRRCPSPAVTPPPSKRHEEFSPLSDIQQLMASSPTHHSDAEDPYSQSQDADVTEGTGLVDGDDKWSDSDFGTPSTSQIPTTSQISLSASQLSMLNWVDNLSQATKEQDEYSRRLAEDRQWIAEQLKKREAVPGTDMTLHCTNLTASPCQHHSEPRLIAQLSPSPLLSQYQPMPVKESEHVDLKDVMLAWYQRHVEQLEDELKILRGQSSRWIRLAGTLSERADGISSILNDAIIWGIGDIDMPPLPEQYEQYAHYVHVSTDST